MSVLMLKSALQQKIAQIEDVDLLTALQVIIDNSMGSSHSKKKPTDKTFNRRFGCGKGIFTYVSDDFDAPLNDFKEYME
ncbi:MAG: hypothetical protein AB8B69_23555 [Chitinophagales bacterium]